MITQLPDVDCKITLKKACELLSRKDKPVSPETHWIEASLEVTRRNPPYSFITLRAYKR